MMMKVRHLDHPYSIVHLTLRNSYHGIPLFFAFLHKYSLFIGSLERSDRAESRISRTFEKKLGEVGFVDMAKSEGAKF